MEDENLELLQIPRETLWLLEPLFEKIVKHALHHKSKVINAEAKKRLREAIKAKTKIGPRGPNQRRLRGKGSKI